MKSLFTEGGLGLGTSTPSSSDKGLFGGGTIIDACDAVTGWSNIGDAGTETLNNTAGEYKEGTGCLNLPATYNTGTASWSKTISSTDLSSKKLYLWFYINNVTELEDSTDTIKILLGTGGFTDYDYYNTNLTSLSSGWNSIYVDINNSDGTAGAGATLSTIDSIRMQVKITTSQATNEMRMDYWRYYEADTLGITDSSASLIIEDYQYGFKTIHSVSVLESNGLDITESGDSDGTDLLSRQVFAAVTKGSNTELQIDKYYYVD